MLYPYEGRTITVRESAGDVALFNFVELCDTTMGSSDFIAIARSFNSIVIKSIPQMTLDDRNVIRRFILLVINIYYK